MREGKQRAAAAGARAGDAGARAWLRDLREAGHAPSLAAGLIHFDVSFMCWVLLGALGAYVAEDMGLSGPEKGVLVAAPLVSAGVLRVVLGVLADRIGPRRAGLATLATLAVPLAWGWLGARAYGELLAVGLLLGLAGASVAIVLPLASRWYPPRLQGLAMGIVAAGNAGSVITALVAPRLAEAIGWRGVFGVALVPLALATVAFALLAREPPAPRPARGALREVAAEGDAWRLCGLYAVTFGGFIGLVSFMPILLHDTYPVSKVDAAAVTAVGAALGSGLRPLGGHLADRLGGTGVLTGVYAAVALLLALLASTPGWPVAVVGFTALLGALGVGNGSVFQLVGLRFGARIGAVTGLVTAAGSVGGALVPVTLGVGQGLLGGPAPGLLAGAVAALAALAAIRAARPRWRRAWAPAPEARV